MKLNIKLFAKVGLALAAIAVSGTSFDAGARLINVRGKVTNKQTGEPIYHVGISDAATGRTVGTTNEEGMYTATIDDAATLKFYSERMFEEATEPVNGRIAIDVQLEPSAHELDEVVVAAKGNPKFVAVEETDLDVVGNYLRFKTHARVPDKLFSSNVRVIIQPDLRNVTRKEITYTRPMVYDGFRYHITQDRMYDDDAETCDPLWEFAEVENSSGGGRNVISIQDSIYVENPNEDFRCDVIVALENYNRVIYLDTVTIASGTVNPLRFLDYSIVASPVVDEAFFPKPEMQLRDTKGEMNLIFAVGKTKLDLSLANNSAELNALISQLNAIERDPDAALQRITIFGTASPEGNPDLNKRLALGRVQSAAAEITNNLSADTRRHLDVEHDAQVATWQDLADLLRADSLFEEAAGVEGVIERFPGNHTRQSSAIRALPYYSSLIAPNYLPRLRRVRYEVEYSKYRMLTDEEIAERYRTNPDDLMRYEYWRLYTIAPTQAERRAILEQCAKVHPNFAVGMTDLAAMKLDDGTCTPELLEPFIKSRNQELVPNETRLNQCLALMQTSNYMRADSLADVLPDTPLYHKAKIYAKALSGHYEDVLQEISEDSPLNEVLMLLMIKLNSEAWQKAQKLGDSAREHYVKAVAANRVDEYMAAVSNLETAFEMDPDLIEIAKCDGDLVDLLPDLIDVPKETLDF